jgi:hypothetical protein
MQGLFGLVIAIPIVGLLVTWNFYVVPPAMLAIVYFFVGQHLFRLKDGSFGYSAHTFIAVCIFLVGFYFSVVDSPLFKQYFG